MNDASVSLQLLLDSFVAIASERDPEAILEQAVDLARLSTQARFGAAVAIEDGAIALFVHQGLTRGQVDAMPHLPEGHGMLGATLEQKTPIRLDSISDDPRSVGFPLGHVAMHSFLGVPVLFEGDLRGALYLTKPPGQGSFDAKDELFMQALAGQTAVALEASRLLRAKDDLNEELRVINQAKSDFVSMASHELRTPLTSIVGFASTLRMYWSSTQDLDKQEYIEAIDRQARRLSKLVGELLAMSRIESGVLEARRESVRLEPLLRRVVEEMRHAEAIQIACADDVAVHADPDHVEQIVLNYLANAVKYGAAPIAVEASTRGAMTEIRVRDAGGGVPDDFVPRLFEKFAQATSGTRRTARGTGLGLSIVRGLAEINDGTAWFEPNQPTGACFCVALPASPDR